MAHVWTNSVLQKHKVPTPLSEVVRGYIVIAVYNNQSSKGFLNNTGSLIRLRVSKNSARKRTSFIFYFRFNDSIACLNNVDINDRFFAMNIIRFCNLLVNWLSEGCSPPDIVDKRGPFRCKLEKVNILVPVHHDSSFTFFLN